MGPFDVIAQENERLFNPEFYAYHVGRNNKENGEGIGWYRRFCIFHISDIHFHHSQMSEAIRVAQNKADVIINSGDDCNGGSEQSRDENIKCLGISYDTIASANYNSIPYLFAPGNHDITGSAKDIYLEKAVKLTEKYSSGFVWGDSTNHRGYGYLDIRSNDMGTFRIILLDPFDYDNKDLSMRKYMTCTFTQKQIDWFVETLKESAGKEHHVITVMHYSFGDNNLIFNEEKAKPDAKFYQDPFMIPDIIDAIQNHSKLEKTYKDEMGINDIVINEDFKNTGKLDYVCHLFGHIHSKNMHWCQKTDGSKKYDILMLGEAALGAYGNILNKVYREPGTVNNIECSALAIDTKEKNIYRINYGAYLKYDKSNSERTEKLSYRLTK